ncbi:BrnA antitoxin family protein [Mesorhizobium sp. M9A.F.Ca.ET.002.03.1.2]|uniref:BrnA antitoxin family protein n=1 Tax=Mesorhizobium sp. M9A.F.Ca.ET.002.03.1.2 TaxID=2493668 RepID=UPI001FDFE974|nr:BrnA antitoxin family protein [Mesorhizobium sp. M9A.F.Ca.ET.002.03.1.2]
MPFGLSLESRQTTAEQIAKGKPFAEAFPDLAESIKRGRGQPPVAVPLQQIPIRLEPAVIEKFKATGKGWQARVNDVLKKAKVD